MVDELNHSLPLQLPQLAGGRQWGPPLLTRQLSQRLVFEALLHQGPISRANLAKVTGLSKQTVSEVMTAFELQGWVALSGRSSGTIGRTALLYRLSDSAAYAVGIDLGGTKLTAAVAQLTGSIVAEATLPTDPRGGIAVLQQITDLVHGLLSDSGIPASRVKALALGTPGAVSPQTGKIHYSPNIPGLEDFDVAAHLMETLRVRIILDNDANLAVLGEKWSGAAQSIDNLVFIAVGTGIGMGVMLDGRLIRGHSGFAGEIGYLPLGTDLHSSAARKHGPLELEIGAAGILRRYSHLGGAPAATVRDLFDRLGQDPQADATLAATAHLLALAVASVATIVDPDLFVLGGSIGSRPELVALVRTELADLGYSRIQIVPSMLGNRAGIVGAVAAALSDLHKQFFGLNNLPVDLVLPNVDPGAASPINQELPS